MRSLVFCALAAVVAALPAFSTQPDGPSLTPSAVTPLHGVVTFIESHAQFYIDLGSADQMPNGEMLTVCHDGVAIAQAQVIKVNTLDSIAELMPENRSLVLEAGDAVVVQTITPVGVMPEIAPSAVGAPKKHVISHQMPSDEPNMSLHDQESFDMLGTLAVIGLIIFH